MSRSVSLAYLTSHRCTPAQSMRIAAKVGCQMVGLRLWPNAPGAPQQYLIDHPSELLETLALQRDCGIGVLDIEIIRIDENFDRHHWDALYEVAAQLNARAILVAGDDPIESRLTANYASLCETLQPYGITADLEFMPWTAVKDAKSALRVVQNAGSPANAGILVDALHFGRSNSSLQDLRDIPPSLLHYVQLCDALAGTHFTPEQMIHTARCERLLPGEGNIDLNGLMSALPTHLPVSVEVVHLEKERHYSPEAWATLCVNASRPYIKESH